MATAQDQSGIDVRSRSLIYLVGQSRAYALQLQTVVTELYELRADDLVELLGAVEAAEAAVKTLDTLGTALLRGVP